MPLTLLRHATQKPPIGPLKLDTSNPLSSGLQAFWGLNDYGSTTPYDFTGNGRNLSLAAGTSPWASSTNGPVLKGNGSSYFTIANASAWLKGTAATLWILVNQDTTSGNGQMAGIRGGSAELFMFHLGPGGTSWAFRWMGANTNEINLDSSVSGAGLHGLAITFDGVSSATSWADGVSLATGGSGNPISTNLVASFGLLAQDNGSSIVSADTVIAGGIWSRVLSATELKQLQAEPYAMFQTRPMQRWFTVVSAGGATIPPGLGPVVSLTEPTLTADLSSMMR